MKNTTAFVNISPGNTDSKSLALIVHRERKTQNVRQSELGAAAGVGISFIVDLEPGKSTLQLDKMLHVLATLGCDVTIIPPKGAPPTAAAVKIRVVAARSFLLAKRYDRKVTGPPAVGSRAGRADRCRPALGLIPEIAGSFIGISLWGMHMPLTQELLA